MDATLLLDRAEVDALVRRLDVAINGDDAAPQARLCDIVAQLEAEASSPRRRVIAERRALGTKLRKLNDLLEGDPPSWMGPEERQLLGHQRRAMREYHSVLTERLARWRAPGAPDVIEAGDTRGA